MTTRRGGMPWWGSNDSGGVMAISIIIPAHNEAGYISVCLSALLASDKVGSDRIDIIVVANACTDDTAEIARRQRNAAQRRGWNLLVIETDTSGKLNALNLAESIAHEGVRIFLDADVIVSPMLITQLVAALDRPRPTYASGSPKVIAPQNWPIRTYARFWEKLPFVNQGAPGFGVFAVNEAGRQLWVEFPDVISDDTFVRLHFAPNERIRVAAPYRWPVVTGLPNLIRVRRRQDAGVAEIAKLYPQLLRNSDGDRPGLVQLAKLMLRDPIGFAVYMAVSLAVRLPGERSDERWVRGR